MSVEEGNPENTMRNEDADIKVTPMLLKWKLLMETKVTQFLQMGVMIHECLLLQKVGLQ
jgi:hypothetical protein